jgi:hypothetical protein
MNRDMDHQGELPAQRLSTAVALALKIIRIGLARKFVIASEESRQDSRVMAGS